MPLLTTTGVSPSLHTWREYDCFMLQMLENILFPATRMPCSYTGSLNFTLLVLQSRKNWVKSKLRNGKETPWPLTGWLVSQPQSWVMSLQLPTNMGMMWRMWRLSAEGWCFQPSSRFSNFTCSSEMRQERKSHKVLLESCWIWDNYHSKA